jgi:hypothetical protein
MSSLAPEASVIPMAWQQSLPKDFIDTSLVHEKFKDIGGVLQYNNTTGTFKPPVSSVSVTGTTTNAADTRIDISAAKNEEFKLKLEELQKQCTKKDKNIVVDLQATRSWDSVESLLKATVDECAKKKHKKDWLSRVENCFSKMLTYGAGIKSWLEILPDGEYTSLLCGGFKLIVCVRHICHRFPTSTR